MTKFAIVIPAYKAADTVAETLESIAACQPEIQDAIAVYLVNDCSPDNQVEVAQSSWRSNLPPLKIISLEDNIGQWPATNLGIKQAHSDGAEWIFLIHADDIAKPNWLRVFLGTIQASDTNVASVCSSYDYVQPNGQIKKGDNNIGHPPKVIGGLPSSVRYTLLQGCWWHISGSAIRVAEHQLSNGFNARYTAFADWDWILRVFSNENRSITYIPQSLIYYRQHENTITAQTIRTTARVEEQIEIISRFASFLSQSDILRWYSKQIYFALRRLGRDILSQNRKGLVTDFRSTALLIHTGTRHLLRLST